MEYIIYSVEDDADIGHLINVALTKQGYKVVSFLDGESFFNALEKDKPNMVLLDMMLPGISGAEILKRLRSNHRYDDIDIIIISANNLLMDKVDGLDLGADDYIEKPFNVLELMSRVNAKVRRFKRNRIMMIKGITLDLDKHICLKDSGSVNLTTREFEILSLLFANKGKPLSREMMLDSLWGSDAIYETRTIDMHINALRKKIGDDVILTVHGVGYKVIE